MGAGRKSHPFLGWEGWKRPQVREMDMEIEVETETKKVTN